MTKSKDSGSGGKGFLGGLFGKSPAPTKTSSPFNPIPTMVLFITDGEPNDPGTARQVIEQSANKNIYFQLIGVGNDVTFRTLKDLADRYDNCGFVQMTNVRMTDEDLYEQLISDELIQFVKKFEVAPVTP